MDWSCKAAVRRKKIPVLPAAWWLRGLSLFGLYQWPTTTHAAVTQPAAVFMPAWRAVSPLQKSVSVIVIHCCVSTRKGVKFTIEIEASCTKFGRPGHKLTYGQRCSRMAVNAVFNCCLASLQLAKF